MPALRVAGCIYGNLRNCLATTGPQVMCRDSGTMYGLFTVSSTLSRTVLSASLSALVPIFPPLDVHALRWVRRHCFACTVCVMHIYTG